MREMSFAPAIPEDNYSRCFSIDSDGSDGTSANTERPERSGPERRICVEEIFNEVADLSVDARIRHFAQHNVESTLQQEVEALLALDSGSSFSLIGNIGMVAQGALDQFQPKGTKCGPYRLGDLLGRGGMGAVYSAERVDGEVAYRVAIKLLRPGSDEPVVRQRFLTERQILANLCHPNIARLLDAGHREDDQPYLAMEYVEGQPIDAYASEIGIRQKISLFLKVCGAVAYMHRNLVVHRDLKPANILVTTEGEPKLLDFGIAKMLDLTIDSTATDTRMLTPDYASPEQMVGRPITTASDIYSLGAVLYKLLTGVSPHQFEGAQASATAFVIYSGRISPPSKLAPGLSDDLEAILMKALRREPQERYAAVEHFSEDLENYLQSRPIRARRGDAWYRARKFLRRDWLPVAAATLTVAGLLAGILVGNYQRAIAQRRFSDVRQLANVFLFDFERSIRYTPGTLDARSLIASTSQRYLKQLAADSRRDPTLEREIAESYERLAEIQQSIQSGGGKSPGDTDDLLQSLEIRRHLGDDRSKDPALRRKYIELASVLGYRYQDEHNATEAARWADEAMDLSGGWVTAEPQNVDALAAATAAFMRGATTEEVSGQIAKAIMSLEKSVTYGERAIAAAPNEEAVSFLLSEAHVIFCDLLVALRRYSDALIHARRSLQLMQPLWVHHPDNSRFRIMFLNANSAVGVAERRLGETDPAHLQLAVPFVQLAFLLAEETMQADPKNAQSKDNFIVHSTRLGLLLVSLKRFDAALHVYTQAYKVARELGVMDPKSRRNWFLLGTTQLDLGWTYLKNNKPSKARLAFLAADEGFLRALAMDATDSVLLERRASQFEGLAKVAWASRDTNDARRWMRECLDVMRAMIKRDPSARSYIGEYADKLKLARAIGISTAEF
jgi:eukaryotic-like serine/threonine-protein kinase